MARDHLLEGENVNLLFNSAIANLLLKTNWGEGETEGLTLLFFVWSTLICFNFVRSTLIRLVGGGSLDQKFLFSTGWNLICCVSCLI